LNSDRRQFEKFAESIVRRSPEFKERFGFSQKIRVLRPQGRFEGVTDIDSELATTALSTPSTMEFC
jgi:hypothetical protein